MLYEHRLLNMHIGLGATSITCLLMLLLLMVCSGKVQAASAIILNVPDSAVPGGAVHLSGSINDNGTAIGVPLGITIKDPHDATYLVDQSKSSNDGSFRYDFSLPGSALAGKWQVFVAGGAATANKALIVAGANGVVSAVPASVQAGKQISFSGKVTRGNIAVGITITDPNGSRKYIDQTTSAADGSFSFTFTTSYTDLVGNWTADVAGGGITGHTTFVLNPASNSGGVVNGGGGGIVAASTPVSSTTGSAHVSPGSGGTVSLGNQASVKIPAGALQGNMAVEVNIKNVTESPTTLASFKVLGSVYEFSVAGGRSYEFSKPVTLTFSFDPSRLLPGERAAIYYYDVATSQWLTLGGTVSGNTITVTVDHFTRFAVLVKKAVSTPVSASIFTDVPAFHWASDFIKELNGLGYINGYPDGQFKPDNSVSRAELVTIVDKVLKLTNHNPASIDFNDVAKTDWFYQSVENVFHAGIVKGYANKSFGPGNHITREELACILVQALGKQTEAKAAMTGATGFTDDVGISHWSRGFVVVAVKYGLIKGYADDNSFHPQNRATRAEVCAMISNFSNVK